MRIHLEIDHVHPTGKTRSACRVTFKNPRVALTRDAEKVTCLQCRGTLKFKQPALPSIDINGRKQLTVLICNDLSCAKCKAKSLRVMEARTEIVGGADVRLVRAGSHHPNGFIP